MFYSRPPAGLPAAQENAVAWILLVMLGMIGGSIVVELILPLAVKEY